MFRTSLFIINETCGSLLIKVLFYRNFVHNISYYTRVLSLSLQHIALLMLFFLLCGHSRDTYANYCSSLLSSKNVMLYAADSG